MAVGREAGSVDAVKFQTGMQSLRSVLIDFDLECILNINKTSLFFKLLPSRTYITVLKNKRTVFGARDMKEKDRIAHTLTLIP